VRKQKEQELQQLLKDKQQQLDRCVVWLAAVRTEWPCLSIEPEVAHTASFSHCICSCNGLETCCCLSKMQCDKHTNCKKANNQKNSWTPVGLPTCHVLQVANRGAEPDQESGRARKHACETYGCKQWRNSI